MAGAAQSLVSTPRLSLRPLCAADAADLVRIVTHPGVGPMLFLFSRDYSHAQARGFIAATAYRGELPFRLAITQGENGAMIGSVGVHHGDAPEVFYFLDPAFGGQGYATEAMASFCAWLFDRWGMAALTADVFCDNPVSDHILRKTGFERVGEGMGKSAARLEPAPVYHYRLKNPNSESARL